MLTLHLVAVLVVASEVPRSMALTADYELTLSEQRESMDHAQRLRSTWMMEAPEQLPGVHGVKVCADGWWVFGTTCG